MISPKQKSILNKVIHEDNIKLIKDVNAFIGMVLNASNYYQLFRGYPWVYSLYEKPYVSITGSQFKLKKPILDEINKRRKDLGLFTDESVLCKEIQYYPRSNRAILKCEQKYCKGESDAILTHFGTIVLGELAPSRFTHYDELLLSGVESLPALINYYKCINFNDIDIVFNNLSNYIAKR